ncbi:MAG: polysaccharide pyruvyl transferase family protein [Lachnospiraceae bacterium]|nr:polysaccharide pyruvyl transferase family protein [Lachnospiraceae bacterium]
MGEYDIWGTIDYSQLYQVNKTYYDGKCRNTGNKVWMQGIISELSTPENQLVYYDPKMTFEQINANFDMVLFSTANLFCRKFLDEMEEYSSFFSEIKIPVFVISCGAQANSYDDLHNLCADIRKPATKFIDTIYNTGGEFGLRGYFTKEVFDCLMSNTAVVTGCPSLFQNGRTLKISEEKLDSHLIKPVFNGSLPFKNDVFKEYPDSIYIDQNFYFNELYAPSFWDNIEISNHGIYQLIKKYKLQYLNLLVSNRLKLFVDIPEWRSFLQQNGYNLSLGSRIHGNIMALLSGIPAIIYAQDTRTREMAEFYNIPYFLPEHKFQKSVYDIYQNADFRKFNLEFSSKYDAFENFLIQHGIVEKMNTDNIFWSKQAPIKYPNESDPVKEEIASALRKHPFLYSSMNSFIILDEKIRWKLTH